MYFSSCEFKIFGFGFELMRKSDLNGCSTRAIRFRVMSHTVCTLYTYNDIEGDRKLGGGVVLSEPDRRGGGEVLGKDGNRDA